MDLKSNLLSTLNGGCRARQTKGEAALGSCEGDFVVGCCDHRRVVADNVLVADVKESAHWWERGKKKSFLFALWVQKLK